jgi:hypothetical protein
LASDIDKKRTAVSNAYSGKKWQDKVAKMPEDQVVAVYLRLQAQNKLPK